MEKIVKVLIGVSLLAGAVWFGTLLAKPTLDDLIERNNRLAAQDSVKAVALSNMAKVWQRLSFDYANEQELTEQLRQDNAALAELVDDQGGTIVSLTRSVNILEDRLTGQDPVVRQDSQTVVEVSQANQYDRGSTRVDGTVTIPDNSDTAQTDLRLLVRTTPLLLYTRDENGVGTVTLDFGDMPIVVDSLEGGQNLNDPIREMARPEFPEIAWKVGTGLAGLTALILVLSAL